MRAEYVEEGIGGGLGNLQTTHLRRPLCSCAKDSARLKVLFIQMHTGIIGSRGFLFDWRVSNIRTPISRCGQGRGTAAHVAAYCLEDDANRGAYQSRCEHIGISTRLYRPGERRPTSPWFMKTRRMREYRVALQIGGRNLYLTHGVHHRLPLSTSRRGTTRVQHAKGRR